MRPFLAALVLCWFTADVVMLVFPIGSVTAEPAPIRVVTVFVCDPPREKDQARMAMGLLLPRLVTTSKYVAADYPPASQAAEQRKRKTVKR